MIDSHIEHCIKYEFDRGSNYKLALKNINDTYGIESLTDSACRQFFKKLRSDKNSDDLEKESETTNDELENNPIA